MRVLGSHARGMHCFWRTHNIWRWYLHHILEDGMRNYCKTRLKSTSKNGNSKSESTKLKNPKSAEKCIECGEQQEKYYISFSSKWISDWFKVGSHMLHAIQSIKLLLDSQKPLMIFSPELSYRYSCWFNKDQTVYLTAITHS